MMPCRAIQAAAGGTGRDASGSAVIHSCVVGLLSAPGVEAAAVRNKLELQHRDPFDL